MAAELIQVIRDKDGTRVLVDGVPLQATAIARQSVSVPVDPDEAPSVDLTLIAARVEVINTVKGT